MKILFVGNHIHNNGPENVNKGLIGGFTEEFTYIKTSNKVIQLCEITFKCLMADVIVVSGLSKVGVIAFKFAKKLKKKCIYIMHGCVEYETEVNGESNQHAIMSEKISMENADFILAVSEKFMKWIQNRYPQYSGKIGYLNNGVMKPDFGQLSFQKERGTVIAVGGDRNTKNNKMISEAVELLEGSAHLEIYGTIHGAEIPKCGQFTTYKGLVSMGKLYERMSCSEIFVLNSIFEPFSLSVIDALNCECSVLLSEVVGINGILQLEESDIIHDPNDKEEIKRKIEYLLEHPNYERIIRALDYDELSYARAVERLKEFCSELILT